MRCARQPSCVFQLAASLAQCQQNSSAIWRSAFLDRCRRQVERIQPSALMHARAYVDYSDSCFPGLGAVCEYGDGGVQQMHFSIWICIASAMP